MSVALNLIEVADEPAALAMGARIHALARELWPLPRSISGEGLRASLRRIQALLPGMQLVEVPSGSQALDWVVPEEWWVREAWIECPDGRRICNFAENNLHLLGYSTAVDAWLSRSELKPYLHSLPTQPEAIPYVTSYYQRRWGFCLSQRAREALPDGRYRVYIDAGHRPGSITYGECLIPGESEQEVLLSTDCCHPAMANNELSGPCLLAHLGAWIAALPRRRLSWRLLFLPEMIGSAAWLQRALPQARQRIVAGFQLSCVGDTREWGYLPSRLGDSLADRIALHVLQHATPGFRRWHWRDRGSDESQYCAPGIDLPVASVMRSKYGSYPEYHTSLDDLEHVVSARGLGQSYALYQRMVQALEANVLLRAAVLGEPQLGRRGLYPSLSQKGSSASVRPLLDLLSMADGRDLLAIADSLECPLWSLLPLLPAVLEHGLVEIVDR